MTYSMEHNSNYFYDVLNYPIIHRCPELGLIIDRCTTKELHDIFPYLIKSIFGVPNGIGWGFRTITTQNNPQEFDVLYNFFIPLGPMFRMCYRLLNDPIKFDIPIELLPEGTVQMLHTNVSQFYSEMITIDLRHRQITSLSLNAFDYYILHFTLHGMIPLHQMYPSALAVHNEKWKSIYFFLTADYLCSFLPCSPDAIVMPSNIGVTMKLPTAMPIQPIKPTRSPKYLSLSALTHNFSATSPTNVRSPADTSSRSYSWRSESVLHLFIDTWLRYNFEQNRNLPSSEFIRVVRILVKQLHAFGNSSDWDNTSISYLRKMAQPLMNEQMYIFLRNVISRWPLDSSFSVVLELWLSYIQPWRYTFEAIGAHNPNTTLQFIPKKYETFIIENLISYTQIFVQLLPRFERLDFSSLKNVLMLFRLIKVFGQANLVDILYVNESKLFLNKLITTNVEQPQQQQQQQASMTTLSSSSASSSSPLHKNLINSMYNPQLTMPSLMTTSGINTTMESPHINSCNGGGITSRLSNDFREWNTFRQHDNSGTFREDNYICLFGTQIDVILKYLVQKILIAKDVEIEHTEILKREQRQKYKGIFNKIKSWFFFDDDDILLNQTISDSMKIPDILTYVLQTICEIFEIELPDDTFINSQITQYSWDHTRLNQFDEPHSSFNNKSETEFCYSPIVMKKRARDIKYTGDPDLIPIRKNEFTFLVRFLYKLSTKLNIMYSNEMNIIWNRNDKWGQLCRQLLAPPIITKTFDKTKTTTRLLENRLGPRISLRFLASYQTFSLIILSFIFGQQFFGMSSIGFLLLILIYILYKFFLTFISDK